MFSYGGYGLPREDTSSAAYCSGFDITYRGLLRQCVEDISTDPKKLKPLHSLVDDFIKDRIIIDSDENLLYDAAFHCIDQDDGALLLKVIQLTSKNHSSNIFSNYSFKFDYCRCINESETLTIVHSFWRPPTYRQYYSQSLLVYACKNNKFNCVKVLMDCHNYFSGQGVLGVSKDIVILSFLECLKNDNDLLIKHFVESIMKRKEEDIISSDYRGANILQAVRTTRWSDEVDLVLKDIDWSTKCRRDHWYRKHIKYIVPNDSFDLVVQHFEETEKDYILLLLKEYLPLPVDIVKFVIRLYL